MRDSGSGRLWPSRAGPFTHHRHAVTCGLCGRWWFGDVVRGAFGQPQAARRETEMCACPPGPPIYTTMTMQIPQPATACACTRALIEALPVYAEAYTADVALRRLADPVPRPRDFRPVLEHKRANS